MNRFGATLIALGMGTTLAAFARIQAVVADEAAPHLVPIQAPAHLAPAPQSPNAATGPQATNFSALDYFQTSCARCHGDYGMFYGDTFGKKLDDAKMHDVVRDMAAGPAQAPLDEKNLAVLVAWHLALRDQKPFVAVTKTERTEAGWKLSGEATPDAALQINAAPVKLEGHTWTAAVTGQSPFQIQARLGDKVTTLDALKAAYSTSGK